MSERVRKGGKERTKERKTTYFIFPANNHLPSAEVSSATIFPTSLRLRFRRKRKQKNSSQGRKYSWRERRGRQTHAISGSPIDPLFFPPQTLMSSTTPNMKLWETATTSSPSKHSRCRATSLEKKREEGRSVSLGEKKSRSEKRNEHNTSS